MTVSPLPPPFSHDNPLRLHHLLLVALVFILGLVAAQSFYVVDQREQAIVLQFGRPVGALKNPGLHIKTPFIQDVLTFDRRVLAVDPPPARMAILNSDTGSSPADRAADSAAGTNDASIASAAPLLVDAFARYKITNPLQFMVTLRSVDTANQRLASVLNDATRTVLGKTTLSQLLSADRANVMQEILDRVNASAQAEKFGIAVIDIRIVRADLTPELRQATAQRMIYALNVRAKQTRSEGEQKATEIRATADKERTVILANATRDAAIVQGEGDQQAIRLYADAFNRDKDFYSFWRTLQAYKASFATPDTRLILSPDSGFLRLLKDGPGAAK